MKFKPLKIICCFLSRLFPSNRSFKNQKNTIVLSKAVRLWSSESHCFFVKLKGCSLKLKHANILQCQTLKKRTSNKFKEAHLCIVNSFHTQKVDKKMESKHKKVSEPISLKIRKRSCYFIINGQQRTNSQMWTSKPPSHAKRYSFS